MYVISEPPASPPHRAVRATAPATPQDKWLALNRWHGRVLIRSRRGTNMTGAFPEIVAAAGSPPDTGLDGELVVWESGRPAFERLQGRLNRTPADSARQAAQWPAHFVAFDLLHRGADLTRRPYAERRSPGEALQ
ncbi:hypothetical protein ACGFYQ_41555 [Streptomyces sp. NPDC048258]|uniref:ATP-dependent DNA ligase n=1 Tax=Streptomyces sp. NPDC048258 TaxID=3365527 RepID=UPI00371B4DC8